MEDRTSLMSLRDHSRGQACQQLLANQISEKEAAERLDISVRRLRRLKKRVRKEGLKGVVHKLKGMPSARRITDDGLQRARDLYQTTCCGWNMGHASQMLSRTHGIVLSSEWV